MSVVKFKMVGRPELYAYLIVRTYVSSRSSILSQYYGLPNVCNDEQSGIAQFTEDDLDKDECYLFSPSGKDLGDELYVQAPESENPEKNNVAFYVYETDDDLGDQPKAGVLFDATCTKTYDSFDQAMNKAYPRIAAIGFDNDVPTVIIQTDPRKDIPSREKTRSAQDHHYDHLRNYHVPATTRKAEMQELKEAPFEEKTTKTITNFISKNKGVILAMVIGILSSIIGTLIVMHYVEKGK